MPVFMCIGTRIEDARRQGKPYVIPLEEQLREPFYFILRSRILFGNYKKIEMRLLRLFFTAVALLVATFSWSQIYVGASVEIGKGYARKAEGNLSGYSKSSYQNLTLNLSYYFNKNVSVATGMGWGIYRDDFFRFSRGEILKIDQDRIEVPLAVSFQTNREQKVNFVFGLGAKVGFLANGSAYAFNGSEFSNLDISYLKRSVQQTGTVGIVFRIKDRNYLALSLFNNLQLNNPYKLDTDGAAISYFGLRTNFSWTPR